MDRALVCALPCSVCVCVCESTQMWEVQLTGRNPQDCSIFDEEMAADQDLRCTHMSRSCYTLLLESRRLQQVPRTRHIQVLSALAHAGMFESMKQLHRLSLESKRLLPEVVVIRSTTPWNPCWTFGQQLTQVAVVAEELTVLRRPRGCRCSF